MKTARWTLNFTFLQASRMFYKSLLLLLPAVAYAQINIQIEAENNQQVRTYRFGTIEDSISNTEFKTWDLSDINLKHMVAIFTGKRPDKVYIRSPPNQLELYKNHNVQEIYRVLKPSNARILGVTYEPLVLATQEMVNDNKVSLSYNAGIKISVEESVSSTWHTNGYLTVSQDISYNLILGYSWELKTPVNLYYAGPWGKNMSSSTKLTLGSGTTVPLNPGESLVAKLTATKGTVTVQVEYVAHLEGYIGCYYKRKLHNLETHDHFVDIHDLFIRTDNYRTVMSDVTLKFVFYADPELIISTNKKLVPIRHEFIPK